MNDIDLKDASWIGIGSKEYYFMGTFDGGGHRIYNIQMSSTGGKYPHVGFFNCIYKSEVINLYLNGYISLDYYSAAYPETIVGSLCGRAKNSKIENVISEVQITYNRTETIRAEYTISIGGLIGESVEYTSIVDCYHNNDIHVDFFKDKTGVFSCCSINVGGIIGESDFTTIKRCGRQAGNIYINANCTSSNTSYLYADVGGIVGSASSGRISYCYNNTPMFEIYIGVNSGLKFGGIAGYYSNHGSGGIINCYSSSDNFHVSANKIGTVNYGGIAGYNYSPDTNNKANYSPSDITVSCIHELNLVKGYFGSTSFTNIQMTQSTFLDELNLYSSLNNQDKMWENKYIDSGYPTLISESSSVYSPITVTSDDHTIYDLEGHIVLHPTRGQIYIKGGKKFIYR